MEAAMPCELKTFQHRETCSESNEIRESKHARIVEAPESTRKRSEGTPPKNHEDHMAEEGLWHPHSGSPDRPPTLHRGSVTRTHTDTRSNPPTPIQRVLQEDRLEDEKMFSTEAERAKQLRREELSIQEKESTSAANQLLFCFF